MIDNKMDKHIQEVHADMVLKLAKDGHTIQQTLDPSKVNLIHMVMGICGEVGELYASRSLENTIEELGDIEFYVEGLRSQLVITRADTLDHNLLPDFINNHSLITSSAEILDLVKKHVIYNQDLKRDELLVALAIFEFHMQAKRDFEEIRYDQTLAANMLKLSKRYENFEYTDEQAEARNDKQDDGGQMELELHH